jgi:hypothetical protein
MKVGLIPWQHQCDRSTGRGLNVPVVSKSPEDAANQCSLLASIWQSHISKLIDERLELHPTQPRLISDLDNRAISKL